jgi:hypothetical protein
MAQSAAPSAGVIFICTAVMAAQTWQELRMRAISNADATTPFILVLTVWFVTV